MGGECACKNWMCSAPYVREVDGRLRGFVRQTCKDCGNEVEVPSFAPAVQPGKTRLERMIEQELPGLPEVEEEERVAPKDSLIARHQRYMDRREEIVQACEATLWIVSEAARNLKIPHSTLWKLLETDFAIDVRAKRREALAAKKEQKPQVKEVRDVVLELPIDPKNLNCCVLEVIERGLANCNDLDDVRSMIHGLKLVKPLLPMCPTLMVGKLPAPA